MKQEINVTCCVCGESIEQKIVLDKGFIFSGHMSIDYGFCKKHAIIDEFINDQCTGCVECWDSCSLRMSFINSNFTITEQDLASIRNGICPKRVNGTLFVSGKIGISKVDLSKKSEYGETLEIAIREYIKNFTKNKKEFTMNTFCEIFDEYCDKHNITFREACNDDGRSNYTTAHFKKWFRERYPMHIKINKGCL